MAAAAVQGRKPHPTDRYQRLERVGKGSFGEVFRGIDKQTQQEVAIKVLDLKRAAGDIEDIQKEISILSQCHDKHITRYYGSFKVGHKLWIVMEFLAGGSAQDLIKPAPLEEGLCASIIKGLLQALQYIHHQNKLHRDVKCENILLAANGDVKLADFGVAGQLTDVEAYRQTVVGTLCFMAPEVIMGTPYNQKADIWSTGITAIQLATGLPPGADINPMRLAKMIQNNEPPTLTGDQYSAQIKDFVNSCLKKDPKDRPTADELLQHPFIKSAPGPEALAEAVARYKRWRAIVGDSEDEDEDDDELGTTGGANDSHHESYGDLALDDEKPSHHHHQAQPAAAAAAADLEQPPSRKLPVPPSKAAGAQSPQPHQQPHQQPQPQPQPQQQPAVPQSQLPPSYLPAQQQQPQPQPGVPAAGYPFPTAGFPLQYAPDGTAAPWMDYYRYFSQMPMGPTAAPMMSPSAYGSFGAFPGYPMPAAADAGLRQSLEMPPSKILLTLESDDSQDIQSTIKSTNPFVTVLRVTNSQVLLQWLESNGPIVARVVEQGGLRIIINRFRTLGMDPQACSILIRRLRSTPGWAQIPITIYTDYAAPFQSLHNAADVVFVTHHLPSVVAFGAMQALSECAL